MFIHSVVCSRRQKPGFTGTCKMTQGTDNGSVSGSRKIDSTPSGTADPHAFPVLRNANGKNSVLPAFMLPSISPAALFNHLGIDQVGENQQPFTTTTKTIRPAL
jgi:hypothetical protein